ncbi:hypothetical protein [Legionella longbeachae]|uniref:hypothetical protein n=1 Tax=Legionella longbeachae TaxID=450 RepID=UPI001C1D7BEE|nr:hypothetical protein [Legionella pneumophila]
MEYEERLCLFIDILGWKEAINTLSADDLLKLLQPFMNISKVHKFHKKFIEDAKKNSKEITENVIKTSIGGRRILIPRLYEPVQLSIFSDTLVLSYPSIYLGRIYNELPSIINAFLVKGFIIRGGISLGHLYHKDNIIFGPALIEAYEIESYQAIFPRILISDAVIEKTGTDSYLPILKDQLENWIIDPFPKLTEINYNNSQWRKYLNTNFNIERIIEIIERNINSSQHARLKDKWVFQAKVCALSLEKYGEATDDLILRLRNLV